MSGQEGMGMAVEGDPDGVAPLRPHSRLTVVESYESFFTSEFPRLVTLARTLSGSRETAEDIAQDAMLVAYRRWEELVRMDQPVAFVRRTCANLAVSSSRRRWAEARALLRLGSRREPLPPMPDEDEQFWTEVRRLPQKQAQSVALFYGCDLPLADVADALGASEGTVKSHLHRARTTLAARYGVDAGGDQDGQEVSS